MHQNFEQVKKEYYRLLTVLDVGSPSWDVLRDSLKEISNGARRLSRLGEQECNGVIGPDGFAKWDDQDQERNDKARERAQKRVAAALGRIFDSETAGRIVVEFQPDPRGPSVILHTNTAQRVACFW